MKEHFDPEPFSRERFKFWSDMQQMPGETFLERREFDKTQRPAKSNSLPTFKM